MYFHENRKYSGEGMHMKLFFPVVMLSNCKPVTRCWFSFFHYYHFQFHKKEFAVNEDDGGNGL